MFARSFQVAIVTVAIAMLAEVFGDPPAGPPPTDADLARAALALEAQDPAVAEALEVMAERGAPPVMDLGETVAILTAAIAVLQTHVRIERTQAGKWKSRSRRSPRAMHCSRASQRP